MQEKPLSIIGPVVGLASRHWKRGQVCPLVDWYSGKGTKLGAIKRDVLTGRKSLEKSRIGFTSAS